jgi:hypothetical protein
MGVQRLADLSIQLQVHIAGNQRTIACSLRPLTPAIREVATAAAAAAWPNSTFCALHTTALALNTTRQGIAEEPACKRALKAGLTCGSCHNLHLSILSYLEARATRPVAAALAVRMERAISTGFDAQRQDQRAAVRSGV